MREVVRKELQRMVCHPTEKPRKYFKMYNLFQTFNIYF